MVCYKTLFSIVIHIFYYTICVSFVIVLVTTCVLAFASRCNLCRLPMLFIALVSVLFNTTILLRLRQSYCTLNDAMVGGLLLVLDA